ncbi:MAG: DUF1302 domain-containing protein [Deltaproteobacteria bacterium]|nr:DUF1302 domain-containing protein [Deltaproteobacteria bacterium]
MSEAKRNRTRWRGTGGKAALAALMLTALSAGRSGHAFNISTNNPDLKMRWDNTLKYSLGLRVEDPSSKVEGSAFNPNLDDGDRNFDRGLISNRFDVLSEFDAKYRDFGLRLSGAAWYDFVYNARTDNDSPATFNPISVDNDEFTNETRKLHGRKAELLDAFVFGKFNTGGETALSVRAGRYTLLYGESLFLGANGIAAAQAPIDVVKLLSVPSSQFKEIGMPVAQLSGHFQVNPSLSLGAYYQLEWRKSRIPASGSYFSNVDLLDDGGERIIAGPPVAPGGGPAAFFRGDDIQARDRGQFGAQVKFKPAWGDVEYGLYAARYHEKVPTVYIRPGVGAGPATPVTGQVGDYVLVYPEDITVFGASFSTVVADANVAGEVSMRRNMPLAATGGAVVTDSFADGRHNPAYPVGNTFHAQISAIRLFPGNFLWGGATFLGEIGFNRRLSVSKNANQLDPNVTRDAWGLRLVFEPQYFQVLPNVDLTVPLGLGWAPAGRSSLGPNVFGPEHGGDMSIGLTAQYQKTWKAGLQYTHFFGPAGAVLDEAAAFSFKQTMADRDFVSLSVQRTF